MFTKVKALILLASTLISFGSFSQTPVCIEVVDSYKGRERVNLSTFGSSIEYISLETNGNTLYSYPTVKGIQGDSIILLKSANRISLFDKKTGKYMQDVGHQGIDPDSFNSPGPLAFNTNNGNVFAYGYRTVLEFDLTTNKIVSKLNVPDISEMGKGLTFGDNGTRVETQISMNRWSPEGYFIGLVQNYSGKEKLKIILYNLKGEILKIYKNHQEFNKSKTGNYRMYGTSLHEFEGLNYTKEWFSDTVFSFNRNSIQPAYYFNTGKHSPPYAQQDLLSDEERKRLMFISSLEEDAGFLYFQLFHKSKFRVGLYDKAKGITRISEPEKDGLMGFYNDIDDFIPFYPTLKTPEGKLIGTISAEDVLIWFEENPKFAKVLPPELQKLKNLDPEDNPVVMIVTPKN